MTDKERGLGKYKVNIDEKALDYLITISDGDGRLALNSLEIGVLSTPKDEEGIIRIDLDTIKECIMVKTAKYDKGGDEHYNTFQPLSKA